MNRFTDTSVLCGSTICAFAASWPTSMPPSP
jgi:hypothetical protein